MNGYSNLLSSVINDDNSDNSEYYFRNSIKNESYEVYEVNKEENVKNNIKQCFPELSNIRVNMNNSDILTNTCEQEATNSINNKLYFWHKNQNIIRDEELQTHILIDLSPKKVIQKVQKKNILSLSRGKIMKEEKKILKRKKAQSQKKNKVFPTNSEKDKKTMETMDNEGLKEKNNKIKIYNCKNIINKLQKNSYNDTIIKKINEDAITQKDKTSISLFEIKNKKRKRENKNKNNQNNIEDKEDIKKGRKKLEEKNEGNHKKDSQDNIIKKIKALFFTCVIEYIEIFLNKYKKNYEGVIKLLKLDYAKYVNRIKKDLDLKLLDTSLKDLASLDTSQKYHKIKDIYWNKNIIKEIIEKEKDNKAINDLLNMSFNDWIDIFTYKKEWEYNIKYDKLKDFIEELSEDNDEKYISKFMLYLYNYKRWFINKAGRNRGKSNNNQGILESNGLLFRIMIN